jgi:hypothetical protein
VTNKELRMLDGEVHEKVMGHARTCLHLSVTRPDPDSSLMVCDSCKRQFGSTGLAMEQFRVPFYSTDIAAAWLVVESVRRRFSHFSLQDFADGWECQFHDAPPGVTTCANVVDADTAPEAICRAALKACARDEEPQ